MSPGPTFDRVYVALKEQLTSARFGPGDHLEPSVLGQELNASITPVRDALHRLVGERLVEAPRNDGFRVPAPTEAQLRDLYGWNRELLDLALRRSGRGAQASPSRARGPDDARRPSASAAELFEAIVKLSGSDEHASALDRLNNRLGAIRAVEVHVFEDWAAEIEALHQAFAMSDVRELKRMLTAYHRRRQRCVPKLLVAWGRIADEPANKQQ